VEKEHKALMEKINSDQPAPTVSPLEETLSRLQEKINQQVQAHIDITTPEEAIKEVVVEPVKETIVTIEEEEVLEEENFEDFVGKLKDILASTKEVKPIKEQKKKEEIPKIVEVKKEEPVVVAQEEEKPIEVNNYVQELEKQAEAEPEVPANNYVAELDKISTKVAGVVEPDKVQDIKKLLEEYMEKYLKKAAVMAEYAGGGGSVAVQYANGGTMNGTLNVTGQYLSGGVDLATIFSGGGGSGDPAVNSLVHSNSGYWNTTYTTVCANSASWGTGGTGLTSKIYKNTNFNAAKYQYYIVDTTVSSVTATLPSSPNIGDFISFQDPYLTWNTNNFIISNNSNMIQSRSENLNCDLNGLNFTVTYVAGSVGWRID